jgi:hypothetical protein
MSRNPAAEMLRSPEAVQTPGGRESRGARFGRKPHRNALAQEIGRTFPAREKHLEPPADPL